MKREMEAMQLDRICIKYTFFRLCRHSSLLRITLELLSLKKYRIKSFISLILKDLSVNFLLLMFVVKKVLIFDMDETLIHCVDDIETEDPDVVLEIDFPDEETVYVSYLHT